MIGRRGFLGGLASALVAAPAVAHSGVLMPLRGVLMPIYNYRVLWQYNPAYDSIDCRVDRAAHKLPMPGWSWDIPIRHGGLGRATKLALELGKSKFRDTEDTLSGPQRYCMFSIPYDAYHREDGIEGYLRSMATGAKDFEHYGYGG